MSAAAAPLPRQPAAAAADNFTRVPSSLFRRLLPTLTPAAWKILCAIVRVTNGWNCPDAALSTPELAEASGTGISRTAAYRVLTEFDRSGLVKVTGRGKDQVISLDADGRDSFVRLANWFVDELMPQCSPAEWKVVSAIRWLADGYHGFGQTSIALLAKVTGLGEDTVRAAVKRLRSLGALDAEERPGRPSIYRLRRPPIVAGCPKNRRGLCPKNRRGFVPKTGGVPVPHPYCTSDRLSESRDRTFVETTGVVATETPRTPPAPAPKLPVAAPTVEKLSENVDQPVPTVPSELSVPSDPTVQNPPVEAGTLPSALPDSPPPTAPTPTSAPARSPIPIRYLAETLAPVAAALQRTVNRPIADLNPASAKLLRLAHPFTDPVTVVAWLHSFPERQFLSPGIFLGNGDFVGLVTDPAAAKGLPRFVESIAKARLNDEEQRAILQREVEQMQREMDYREYLERTVATAWDALDPATRDKRLREATTPARKQYPAMTTEQLGNLALQMALKELRDTLSLPSFEEWIGAGLVPNRRSGR